MAKRRGHGEGTIYKETKRLRDGREAVYWRGEIFLGHQDGKKQVRRVTGKTRREVAEQITKLLKDHQDGLPIDANKITVADYLSRWLSDNVRHSVRHRTFSSYKMNVERHLIPGLGSIALRRLSPADVQRFYSVKLESGLAPRTVAYLHSILHRALTIAVKQGMLPRNVCDAVDRPKVKRQAMKTLNPDEARRFLAAAEGDRFHALFTLALTTGLRQGELLGLRWEDVDLENGTLAVRRQSQWNRETKQFELSETKGGKGRTVALPPMAVRALKLHQWRQTGEARRLGDVWDNRWDLVFTTEVGTPVNHGNLLRRHFFPLLEKAGCPRIRFHDLRHSCASLLLARNVNLKIVSAILGHASVALTADVYSHVAPSMQEAAAAEMEAVLASPR